MALEGEETRFKFGQRREIVRSEDLPLYDREIDLDLIEPTGVDWSVDEDRVGPFGAIAVDSFLATMGGAVVHNPEDAASGLVGLLAHDVADESLYWSHPILDFATPENLGAMDIPGSQVCPGAFAKVLMLNPGRAGWTGRYGRLLSAASLNACLLVGRDHEVICAKWGPFPNAFVEIEDGASVGRKVGITREDPASMLPWAESVSAEPAPQGGAADFRDEAL